MDGRSLTPQEEKLKQLKEILPEAFAEGKVDWEKLKATLGEDINFSNERYVLNWAGKSEAFKVLQAPTTKTLVPAKDESLNFDETENIFIEGENLEVLKVLQKSYFGKVKMVYIDPPYNTGNDSFIYPDKFSETKAEYQKRVGDKNEEGYMTKDGMFRKNSKENGQYHSNWLNMMYPRLFLAKNLLKQNGVIFISISDDEIHNLRLLMNEVFGEENFIAQLIWKSRQIVDSRAQNGISNDHEYILVFSKSDNVRLRGKEIDLTKYSNPDNDVRGSWMSNSILGLANASQRPNLHYKIKDETSGFEYDCPKDSGWRYSPKTMKQKIEEKRIVFPKKKDGRPREKKFLNELTNEFTNFSSLLNTSVGYTLNGTREVRDIFNGNIFSFPKPVSLLNILIEQGTPEKNELILDFFSGSGTLAHSVFDINKKDGGSRKYICVQLPEQCDEKSEAYKAGYKTIADISKERIRRASKKIQAEIEAEKEKKKGQIDFEPDKEEIEIDLGFKVLKLSDSNFKQWQQIKGNDAKALEEQMKLFVDPVSEKATTENMVYELLLKSGKNINSKLEYKAVSMSAVEGYHCVNDNELIFMLEKATQEIVDSILKEKPQKVIALDKLFKGNDQLKTNTSLQMRDAGIEFKTI